MDPKDNKILEKCVIISHRLPTTLRVHILRHARQICIIGKQFQYKVMDIAISHMSHYHHGKRADLEVNEKT